MTEHKPSEPSPTDFKESAEKSEQAGSLMRSLPTRMRSVEQSIGLARHGVPSVEDRDS